MAPKRIPQLKDILSFDASLDKRLVPTVAGLKKLVSTLKAEGFKIVLTQGVWDLIHEGHAKYLQLAKARGDVLVVAVDSDELTRLRKGPSRPIVPERERLNMLSHLRHVDILFLRTSRHGMDVTNQVIQAVAPDVLVLSKTTSDLPPEKVRKLKKFADNIVYLDPQSTTSTTARIRILTIGGAEELARKISSLVSDFLKTVR